MKTCIYCGEPVSSEDEDPNEPAHHWCANGEENPDEPVPLDRIYRRDLKKDLT